MTLLTPSALLEIEERAGKATARLPNKPELVCIETRENGRHDSHYEINCFVDPPRSQSQFAWCADYEDAAAIMDLLELAEDNVPALLQHISALQEQIERARDEGAKEMRERIWDALHETMPPNRVMSLKCDDKIEDGAQIGWMTCNDTFLDIVREFPLLTTPQAALTAAFAALTASD